MLGGYFTIMIPPLFKILIGIVSFMLWITYM